jgi:hypothetical protein
LDAKRKRLESQPFKEDVFDVVRWDDGFSFGGVRFWRSRR